ncbi:glutathione S-transferase C-terminal domain-containing protein [Dunckerocampus dactyliophorus]|uniref:glutathione S-transferase C-terminal domain-containing protein n=1 Tax=Dunckerocampus dactyliophorus TaxID=161453 RepID=UPI00240654C6|nr:glutathione S-transferase C-terminal domain-containing protein [Dunckerocampus dactyliophorus]XP_054634690.1 glutathione S-transferase C-terminal domain-containing protein [Dunckerocampus dactyliophorus]
MKEVKQQRSSLFLEVCCQKEEPRLPLHSSIAFFLLSYCDCDYFKVHLVSNKPDSSETLKSQLPECVDVRDIRPEDLPQLVRGCRLPAVLDETGRLCRAGLAVVLRHIINKTIEADPSRNDVLALLGFKKTCLKACAEVSKWTRLCEIGIPSAVEDHIRNPPIQLHTPPISILTLEQRLAEPVKVHNDDKIRRQKLQEQRRNTKNDDDPTNGKRTDSDPQSSTPPEGLELRAALAKLSVAAGPSVPTRECSEIRKVKTNDLPELEHVFAEGLYFTLTDVVLLPCIHQYLTSLPGSASITLHHLPHLLRWYSRVQEVPGLLRAAKACGITLVTTEALLSCPAGSPPSVEGSPLSQLEPEEDTSTGIPFVGGPRPTMSKLKESGIVALFAPHPHPEWTLPWDSLPDAISPTEGKMSNIRTIRKKQQLNNLVAMVTQLAKPGHTVVDFCSGTGHVGIVLAHALPHCQVLLIENKEESLMRAQSRSTELGLENIGFIQANLDYFTGPFHIGVALHACGVATDMVMEHCIQAGAAFVISPCCYGFIPNATKFTFPRSKRFQETLIYKEHMILCRFADQTAPQLPPERRLIGKQCMGLVDLDRSWAAESHGYRVQVMTMEPDTCSPKNNMLIGKPHAQDGAH